MRPVGSELERDGESGFLAKIGYLESVFLFGLFALSLEVAFFENEHLSGAEMLAGPIALGLAVVIALRAGLSGVLGVVFLSLILLVLSALFSGPAWDASRFFHALSLVGVIVVFASFAGLVVGYQRRSRDLQEQGRNMLHKMFDALPIGVWVRARNGGTIFVNERWASFGDQAADTIMESADTVPPVDLGPGWEDELKAILESEDGAIRYRSIELRDNTGQTSSLTLLSLGLYIDPLEEMGTLSLLIDETALRLYEKDLEWALDRAESANQAKSQFIGVISHEIRTPLNAIIGMSSYLMESEENVEKKEFAETIYNSGRSLLLLLNDILDFSRIEAGHCDLEVQEFPLRLVFDDCVKLFRFRAAEKKVQLNLDIAPNVPEYAFGDMERLRQILQNLLSNALKFTDEGRIKVAAQLVRIDSLPAGHRPDSEETIGFLDERDHEYLRVQVSDTGIGIPPDQQDALFEAFSQVDTTATRKHGGTGLGLVICQRLVEAMGGKIWLKSGVDEGTAVSFFIRTKTIDDPPTKAPEQHESWDAAQQIVPGAPCHILIVGEARSVRPLILACRRLGYRPDQTDDFNLEHPSFSSRRYNIVCIHMGYEDASWKLVRQITAQGHSKRPDAIVGVAAGSQEIPTDRLELAGMRAVIGEKPGSQELQELIREVSEGEKN